MNGFKQLFIIVTVAITVCLTGCASSSKTYVKACDVDTGDIIRVESGLGKIDSVDKELVIYTDYDDIKINFIPTYTFEELYIELSSKSEVETFFVNGNQAYKIYDPEIDSFCYFVRVGSSNTAVFIEIPSNNEVDEDEQFGKLTFRNINARGEVIESNITKDSEYIGYSNKIPVEIK